MGRKAVRREFHNSGEKNILVFSFRKVASKRYKELDNEGKLRALEFIEECEKDLLEFKKELMLEIKVP